MSDPAVAFRVREREEPSVEVRVNFGVFAGRNATPAEIDDLARALHDELRSFAIVAEDRHEFGGAVEASLHQVVIEVGREAVDRESAELAERVVAVAQRWAEACFAARHVDV